MKLPGVTEVKIEAGEKPKTQKVTVISSKTGITKEDAIASLGKKASRFKVVTWSSPTAEG